VKTKPALPDDSPQTIEDIPAESSQAHPAMGRISSLTYGSGTLGLVILGGTFDAYVYFYYVDVLGLVLTLAATVRLVYAIWDALDNPLFAYLSDNTRTRFGRRHPWLLVSLPLYLLFFGLVFTVPESFHHSRMLFWYLLGAAVLYETLGTIVGVNYGALFPELFQKLPDRIRAGAFNRAGHALGLIVGLVFTPWVYHYLGFAGMAWLYAGLAGSLLLISILSNAEQPPAPADIPVGTIAAFRDILRERVFWWYALALTFIVFAMNLFPLAIPFFAKYTLEADESAISLIFGVSLLVALLAMPLWAKLIYRWSARNVLLWVIGLMAAACVGLGLAPNLASAVMATTAFGLGWAGFLVCHDVLQAGLVDQHQQRTGQRSEGVYYSLLGFSTRLAGVLQSLALVLIGVLFGYVSGENPGPQPGNAFRFLIGVVPVISLVLAWPLAYRFFLETAVEPTPQSQVKVDYHP
jgi:GPH family glycoside/pentoside/hexuronide:cation symporter